MPFTECQLGRRRASQAGRVRRTGTRRQRQEHLLLPAQIAIWDTNRDRPSGRSFFVLGLIPPPLNFAKIHARGGRGLQPEQPKDSIPPWGHSGTQRRGAATVPESGGHGEKAAVCLGGPDRAGFCRDGGERALCRAAQRALSALEAGAFLPGGGPPTGRGRGLAAWGPQRPRVGRDGAGRARCRAAGRARCRAAGRGRYTAAFRGGRGEGVSRAAVYGGRRPRTGGKHSELRGLCRVTGHRWEGRQRRGQKGPFSLYKEALFAGARALSIQS